MRKGAGREENLAHKSYGPKFWPINRMGGMLHKSYGGGGGRFWAFSVCSPLGPFPVCSALRQGPKLSRQSVDFRFYI